MNRLPDTPQLHFRPLTAADAEFILQLVNEPAWLRFIGDRQVHTPPDALRYIETCHAMHRQHGVGLLAVELKSEATPIGLCGLLKREQLRDVDLGIAFLAAFRGRGYGREAAEAVLRHGHAVLGYERIAALTHPENAVSIRLLQNLGFRFETQMTLAGAAMPSLLFLSLAGWSSGAFSDSPPPCPTQSSSFPPSGSSSAPAANC